MKYILALLLISTLLEAKELVFSGGKGNVAHQIGEQVLKKAYAKIGMKPNFVYNNLEKSLQRANKGEFDGEIARIKEVHTLYPNLIAVPVVINHVEAVAFSVNKALHVEHWSDLKEYSVGVLKGAKFIELATQEMNPQLFDTFETIFLALQEGKIEIMVIPKTTGLIMLHRTKMDKIYKISSTLARVNLYHYLHVKNKQLLEKITPVLEQMRKSGEMYQIRQSYFKELIFKK